MPLLRLAGILFGPGLFSLLLFRRNDGVLGGFRHTELHHLLGRDLDRFAGRRIAARARFAVLANQAPDPRQYEHTVLLYFPDSHAGKAIQELAGYLVVHFATLGEASHQLRLRHTLTCHSSPLILTIQLNCNRPPVRTAGTTPSIELRRRPPAITSDGHDYVINNK